MTTQALLIRLSHKELRASGLQMLEGEGLASLGGVALAQLETLKLYDEALRLCKRMGDDPARADSLARTAACYHHQQGNAGLMLEAVRQFSSLEARIRFLRKSGDRTLVAQVAS